MLIQLAPYKYFEVIKLGITYEYFTQLYLTGHVLRREKILSNVTYHLMFYINCTVFKVDLLLMF